MRRNIDKYVRCLVAQSAHDVCASQHRKYNKKRKKNLKNVVSVLIDEKIYHTIYNSQWKLFFRFSIHYKRVTHCVFYFFSFPFSFFDSLYLRTIQNKWKSWNVRKYFYILCLYAVRVSNFVYVRLLAFQFDGFPILLAKIQRTIPVIYYAILSSGKTLFQPLNVIVTHISHTRVWNSSKLSRVPTFRRNGKGKWLK